MIRSLPRAEPATASSGAWKLQDAKARFSELVRLARERGPQRVSVHGRDAVVVLSAEDFDRMQPRRTGAWLVECMARSPLADLDFERSPMEVSVRDVEV